MLLATWNVNSIRARLPRVLPWLEERQPDVVCLQETKCIDDEFPRDEIEALRAGGPAHGIRFDGLTHDALLKRAGALLRGRSAWVGIDPAHHDVL